MPATNEKLIGALKEAGVLRSARVEAALRAVDRGEFVPEALRDAAYEDEALPIGMGQTISQPYTVVFMLELLGVKEGGTIFDVGHGSGWQTALLAHLVGGNGKIYATEIIPELCEFGETNVAKYPELYRRVVFECGDASHAAVLATGERLDRLIAAADVQKVPESWRKALREGGVLVYPNRGVLKKERKLANGKFAVEEYPGFAFVPFVSPSQKNDRSELIEAPGK